MRSARATTTASSPTSRSFPSDSANDGRASLVVGSERHEGLLDAGLLVGSQRRILDRLHDVGAGRKAAKLFREVRSVPMKNATTDHRRDRSTSAGAGCAG